MDFMERMDTGRAERKRTLERTGGTSVRVVTTAEYWRRRGAGHDDRTDAPYWEPKETMTDDDWNALCGERVAGAVDATPACEPGRKETTTKPAKDHSRNFTLGSAFRRPVLTEKQYVNALKKLGLTPYGAAPVLGISARMSMRYAAGTHAIPETLAKLVRAMATLKALGHGIDV